MKKLIMAAAGLIAAAVIFLIFFKSRSLEEDKHKVLPEFSLTKLDGSISVFKKENYPKKLILNFFGTECGLCSAEMNDIISFSKTSKTDVLFLSPDSLSAISNFASELKARGVTYEGISFAKISIHDAKKIFSDAVVPQSIIFDEGLKIKRIKKGVLSYQFPKKSFE